MHHRVLSMIGESGYAIVREKDRNEAKVGIC
jgi:hypothetical protein